MLLARVIATSVSHIDRERAVIDCRRRSTRRGELSRVRAWHIWGAGAGFAQMRGSSRSYGCETLRVVEADDSFGELGCSPRTSRSGRAGVHGGLPRAGDRASSPVGG